MSRIVSEDALVARLGALFATRRRDVVLGIGDDAAWVKGGDALLLATDTLVEGEDFLAGADPKRIGRKALAVNLSDIAAMGGVPLHALLTLGLPPDTDESWVLALADGVREVAREHGVAVVGGDLTASATAFVTIALTGRPAPDGPTRRAGARPGDEIFVSGTLGAAAGGLALLRAGYRLGPDGAARGRDGRKVAGARASEVQRLIRHQLDPRPMVELGRSLAELRIASAAIDLSDGLARDLHRLLRASGAGAVIDLDAMPVDSALHDLPPGVRVDPVALALFGGEDFGLLFAVPHDRRRALDRLAGRVAVRRIGVVTRGSAVEAERAGRRAPLPDDGFDHFAAARPRRGKRKSA